MFYDNWLFIDRQTRGMVHAGLFYLTMREGGGPLCLSLGPEDIFIDSRFKKPRIKIGVPQNHDLARVRSIQTELCCISEAF